MKQSGKTESLGDVIVEGLKEAVAWAKGQVTLRRIDLELPSAAPKLAAAQIAALRNRLGFSQVVFAKCMNVSVRTIQAWEQGLRTPDGAAFRLMDLVAAQPALFSGLIRSRPNQSASGGSRARRTLRGRPSPTLKKAA